jgi:hypothetical protein
MARRAIYAPRDGPGAIISATTTLSPDGIAGFSTIHAPTSTSLVAVTAASPLTTYTSYTTSTFVSGGTTYKQSQGALQIVSNSAELASLSAAGAFNTQASSTTDSAAGNPTGSAAGAAATSSAASAQKSSNSNTSTLIPAIVVPVVVLLLASFAAFFFFMRRRHHRALEEEARFEKAKPNPSPSSSSPADNSSSRNLLPTSAAFGQSPPEKTTQSFNAPARGLPDGHAASPPRPRRPDETEIPSSAIGIARSTSSASAVYTKGGPRPPRSAHEMRGLPLNSRPDKRVPRSQVLSGGDIIDSYADMRPSTAPSGSHGDYSSRSEVMRTPLPLKPMGRPPPKNPNPQYTSNPTTQSPSRTSPAAWGAISQARNSPALSRAQAGSPDSDYGLTEENLRVARLVNGSMSAGQTPDNASISDIDEHDHVRAQRDDASDISDLDEEQEHMVSGLNTPMGTGRGTPMSGRMGTPLGGRGGGYVR